jgi:glycine/D-amino acid oxidase-like deaminating enzyme
MGGWMGTPPPRHGRGRYDGLLLACGHSGHGIQQSIATGRAVSELVLDGEYTTLDLSSFSYERYSKGEQMLERNIV